MSGISALYFAALIVAGLLLVTGCFLSLFHYQVEKVIWKPHVYRSVDGEYNLRAYYLFGYKWLHYSDWKFTQSRRSRRNFRSLEDATQAFERFQEKKEESAAAIHKRKADRKAAKASSGVVHRF